VSALVVDTSSWIAWLAGGGSERAEFQDMRSDLTAVGTDPEHWFRVGRLRAELRARGLSVSTPDAHVAQCAIDTGGVLLTEDRVFEKIAKVVPLKVAGTRVPRRTTGRSHAIWPRPAQGVSTR
jgi:predicted nucleic acid-binding protein